MKFSYNWLQSFFKEKLPKPEKLAELLTLHFAEVEEVRKEGKDYVLDIDIRPNRASDCFSHLGIARECSIFTNFKLRIQKLKPTEDKKNKAGDFLTIEVKDKMVCSRYTARIVFDVVVGSSPAWLKQRLLVCGLRPINNIVDITNYVMLETGQPLHVFDFRKIENKNLNLEKKKLIVRFAKKGEKIVTLDEEKYDLDKDVLIIADEREPLAIAGIKGGEKAKIDEKTRTVVLESANFNPLAIRYSSKAIDLKTDASWRFEHSLDPSLTKLAVDRAAYLIQEIANGRVAQNLIDFYPQKVLSKRIKLDFNYIEKLLGRRISRRRIEEILKKLNFSLVNQPKTRPKSNLIIVEVPTFRNDISIPEDLIEEIGRIYGYDKIFPIYPTTTLIPPKRNFDFFWEERTKDILKEVGFSEVYNYSFLSEKDKEVFGRVGMIQLENPLSEEFKYLRPSLIPNLLKDIQKNQEHFKEIRIFELGKIFYQEEKIRSSKQIEKRMLSGLMTGEVFYEIKGVVDLVLNQLGISDLWYDEYQPRPEQSKLSIWNLRKCAEIKIDGEKVGFLGEISSEILDILKIKNKVYAFDIDFEKLSKLASEEIIYRPISRFPAAIRDIAVLVPKEIKVEDVLNIIELAGGKILTDVDLFDIYEGEEIPEGKKNLAFHLVFQAQDHTLTSQEIEEIQGKIINELEKQEGWMVRK